MKTVCSADQCAGCMACIEMCPKQAIQICDNICDYQAIIDEEKCVDCNLCHKICQALHQPVFREPIAWYEGWTTNTVIREKTSSGGIATELAVSFIKKGGVVYGCVFESGEFVFSHAKTVTDVWKFAGSKYVKSNPYGIYKEIKNNIYSGIPTLFIGLPCQVSALKNVVGDNNNLFTVDLICHGTPSPKILAKYMKDLGYDLMMFKSISFRSKTSFRLEADQKQIIPYGAQDYYTMAFLDSTTYTENCYSCKYARRERIADITLGDSWGSQLPSDIQMKGVSLMMCQTEKGHELLKTCAIIMHDIDLERSVQYNHQLRHPSTKTAWRDSFFKGLIAGKSFEALMFQFYPKRFLKDKIKKVLYAMKLYKGGNSK